MIPQASRNPPEKTLADYLVIGVSPVLIMLLVGSLAFFLVEVFYRGELALSVRWILFWYVLGTVLVSRIGIENGPVHAAAYGAPLAVATGLYLLKTHPGWLLGLILLVIVWWSAQRLTKDCTLVDDQDDASGTGLLQAAGRRGKDPETHAPPPPEDPVERQARRLAKSRRASPALRAAMQSRARTPRRSRRSRYAPGVWVVYFSLAALPLFGVGQLLQEQTDTSGRTLGFGLLMLYLMAALGLLLSTSFLGLRRYLRQRRVTMPANITAGWLTAGGGLALTVLILATLAPRPGAGAAWAELAYQIDRRIESANAWATLLNPASRGESAARAEGGTTSETYGQANGGSGRQGQGEGERGDEGRAGRLLDGAVSSIQGAARNARSMLPLLRFLVYLALAIILIGWLFRHRRFLLELGGALWLALSRLWSRRPAGADPKRRRSETGTRSRERLQPFAAFRNPFLKGLDRRWPPERLIVYSFDALKAWSREAGIAASHHLTPREFGRVVAESYPDMEDSAVNLASLYSHAAYGPRTPELADAASLRRLWEFMESTGSQSPVGAG